MTTQIDEQISAFMDGELHTSEHATIIQKMCRDDQSLNCWQRYHLISDTLKNNLPPAIDNRFAQSVMAALEKEPTVFAPAAMKHKTTIKQKITGAAIAASVAAVAVIGVQNMNQPKETAPSLAQMPSSDQFVRLEQPVSETVTVPMLQSAPESVAGVPALRASASTSTSQDTQITQIYQYHPQLNKYLLNHHQHTVGSQVQGVMPYARIVVTPVQSPAPEIQQQQPAK